MIQRSGWQLSGSAPEAYERYIVRPFIEDCTYHLVDVAALQSEERVLDVACGTGVVARLAASRLGPAGYVVGLDTNPGMLAMARGMTLPKTVASVIWQKADVIAMPFPDADFHVLFCQQGLQFFADKSNALAEMHRVLMPGGRLVLSVWRALEHCPWQRAVADALENHVSEATATSIRVPFALGESEEINSLLKDAGFRDVQIGIANHTIRHVSLEEFVPGYLFATPVASTAADLDERVLTAIVDEIRASLRSYIDDNELAIPISTHVAVAFK